MSTSLNWPREAACPDAGGSSWHHAGSNLCLDFHGDPLHAGLAVFSDGNHHMGLAETLQGFVAAHPEVGEVFYASTPPGVLVAALRDGGLWLGNLRLTRLPEVFISPPGILDALARDGLVASHRPFMASRGNVLLVSKGNPLGIRGVTDLLREDVRLFISSPEHEKASYEVYRETLLNLVGDGERERLTARLEGREGDTVFGERIHHREAPQAIFDGHANVAVVYYHLALRYCRIFPETFEIVPLGGNADNPRPLAGNVCTTYHVGLVGDGGRWGAAFIDYIYSDTVTAIYAGHGLRRP